MSRYTRVRRPANYRLRKFARRNKVALTTVCSSSPPWCWHGVSAWQAVRPTRPRRWPRRAWTRRNASGERARRAEQDAQRQREQAVATMQKPARP